MKNARECFRRIYIIGSLLVFLSGCTTSTTVQESCSDAYLDKGLSSYRNGDVNRAIETLTQGIEQCTYIQPLLSARGYIYKNEKNYEAALLDYKRLLQDYNEKNRWQTKAVESIMEIYHILGNTEEAEKYMNEYFPGK